ncbi:MAG: membrane fusion protein (multidrug efflux system) [Planctomycetota bacterium]|jgi:membrane fusion protein (multidrug efflux system)
MNFSPATALVAAGAFVGAALALSCSPDSSEASAVAAQEALPQSIKRREATRVRVQPVEQREMERALSTTTVVESETEIKLFPRVTGVVIAIAVEEGDRVEANQVLALLDDREASSALQEAKIALREAEENVPRLELSSLEARERCDRAKLAFDQATRVADRNESTGLISTSDLDEMRMTRDTSELDWKASKLAWDGAQQDLKAGAIAIEKATVAVTRQDLNHSYTKILAPFDGVIASRTIKVGDSASPSAEAFVLTDPDNLRAVFHRPQREFSMFQAARRAIETHGAEPLEIRVAAEAYPDRTFRGSIRLVSPTVSAESGSFRVTVELEPTSDGNQLERLLPGMLVRLSIVTERHAEALVVPKRALRREGDTYFVFIDNEGKARRVEVESGFSTDEDTEVTPVGGQLLAAGESVIVIGNRDLEEGSEVDSSSWQGESMSSEVKDTEQGDEAEAASDEDAGAEDETTSDSSSEEESR